MTSPEAEPLRFRSGFAGELGSKLHKAALEGVGTDVEIRIGVTSIKTVHAHAAVLELESEVFKVMLSERWKTEKKPENGKTTINLPEDKYSEFVLFLQLLYGFQDLTVNNFNLVLPAYKLVDKYAAHTALRLCKEYSWFLIGNMDKLDIAKLLRMAKDHKIDELYESALHYVKINLSSVWIDQFTQLPYPHQSWMDWDEETLIEIISTDGLKVLANQQQRTFDWSANEYMIAYFTAVWLHCGRFAYKEVGTDYKPPTHKKSRKVDLDSSSRVFSKLRFLQMKNNQFQKCIRELLVGRLPKGHIADIAVAYSGKGETHMYYEEERDFEVDKRLRKIQNGD